MTRQLVDERDGWGGVGALRGVFGCWLQSRIPTAAIEPSSEDSGLRLQGLQGESDRHVLGPSSQPGSVCPLLFPHLKPFLFP